MALKSGQLEAYFPDFENPIIEAASCGVRAFNLYENEQMQKVKQRHG